jgi:DNA-binding transcriptional LysR family regulator
MTLEQLIVLVKVVDSGGFSRAAEIMAMQRSNVSRAISLLEAELGVKLLERTTRRQSITEAGREVYERAVGIIAAVDDTVRITQRIQDEPGGLLRLTCGVEFGMVSMGRLIEEYLARYPRVDIEVEYTSRELDLVHEGFDLAIRAGPLAESRLVARLLGQFDYGLFASPRYAAAHGLPGSPAELAGHKAVIFTGGQTRAGLTLQHPEQRDAVKVTVPARLRVNAGTGLLSGLIEGLGIGQLPIDIAADLVGQGKLVPVMPSWRPPSVKVYAVYPSNRYLTPKVRAFVDLALDRFPWPAGAGAKPAPSNGGRRRTIGH